MDILYIRLGGKAGKQVDGLYPAMYVTYGEGRDDDLAALPWQTDTPGATRAPLTHLTMLARLMLWRSEADHVLQRHNIRDNRATWLEANPQVIAQLDTKTFTDIKESNLIQELMHVARRIVERKTAFVFPEKWEANVKDAASQLAGAMVGELCAHFRDMPIEGELPWAFLSMMNTTNGLDLNPLDAFIRDLHSQLLTGHRGLDVVPWVRKHGAILLSGPTGSGKSYAARLLAADKNYSSKLVEINLASVNEDQLESRMRGYVGGTFTGADRKGRKGWFEQAEGGVLFLDEFQSVSEAAQVQLLDLLSAVSDDIHIAQTGADEARKTFRVKVILAINEDLNTLLHAQRLRKDVYYRVRHIEAFPSLKERLAEDIEHRYLRGLLASYRWKSLRSIDQLSSLEGGWRDMVPTFFPVFKAEALSELAEQEWDGNFRELERVAFDLYYQCDYQEKPPVFDRADVSAIVKAWHTGGPGNQVGNKEDDMAGTERMKLDEIQRVLRQFGFVINTVLQKQAFYRSRLGLKKYLLKHVGKLDAEVRGDSRMVKFLKLEPDRL